MVLTNVLLSGSDGAIFVGFLAKEETLALADDGILVEFIPEFWTLPLDVLSLPVAELLGDDFGDCVITSFMESILFVEAPANPLRCCFFFLAKSYMSPKMPAKVLRKFFIVSSASSTTEPCCCGPRACC